MQPAFHVNVHRTLAALLILGTSPIAAVAEPSFTLVEDGVCRAPIVIDAGASPATRQAARELAQYIEKISGARPEILEGRPGPIPDHAVWVGAQPGLETLFPEVDLEFRHPEEILLVATADHLLLAGRDRWDPALPPVEVPVWGTNQRRPVAVQRECGSANAVYTFLQEKLEVRWLWPGELGEDIVPRKTLAFAPFVFRYHPVMRQRDVLHRQALLSHRFARYDHWADWSRFQRLQLGSLRSTAGVHAFSDWAERFYDTQPELFALQPDGSRRSWGQRKGDAKVCLSNPAVQEQWFRDAEENLRRDPTMTALPAGENDGHSSWICVCERCRAWDDPEGAPWQYSWEGVRQEYVAMSDRYVTFWNLLAQGLKERFPERDDLLVLAPVYGPSKPLPVKARLTENTLLSYVGGFPGNLPERQAAEKAEIVAWAAIAPGMVYRPNLFYFGGASFGLPEIYIEDTAKTFRFLAENRCEGLSVDSPPESWGTAGPQYYLMGQLAWNPFLDAETVMKDYYHRGFGPAAGPVERYWRLVEATVQKLKKAPEYAIFNSGGPWRQQIPRLFPAAYSATFFREAEALLDQAAERVSASSGVHARRVAFVRAGLEFLRLMIETIPVMTRVRESGGSNRAAVQQALANWEAIRKIEERHGPYVLDYQTLEARMRLEEFFRGGVADYFGPPSEAFQQAAGLLPDKPAPQPATAAAKPDTAVSRTRQAVPASASGNDWVQVFSDDFQRNALGDDWRVVDGKWSLTDGQLVGHGTLLLNRAVPGFQRLEFEVASHAGSVSLFGEDRPAQVSDLSAILQAQPEEDPVKSGYLFQFGGQLNTLNRISRAGSAFRSDENPAVRIEPERRHRIVAENDGGTLRLTVDGQTLLEGRESASFVGEGQDRAGLYLYTPARVFSVKLFIKPLADDTI